MKKFVLVLSLILLVCMSLSASAILTYEELQSQIDELEQRVDALEDDQSSHETRISALESWKLSIQLSVNAIGAQLESVKQWLFFWNYQGGDVCDALDECGPQIECSSDSDCSPDTSGNAYCVGTDIYHDVRDWFCADAGTAQSHCGYTDNPVLVEDCIFGCENGQCKQGARVIFRTNVVQGSGENYNKGLTSDSLGAWIAFDMNQDGMLEGYGKTSGSILTGCSIALAEIGRTPDGFRLINDTSGNLGVCYTGDKGYARKYSTSDSDASNAVLTIAPTEPYTGRGQELYDGSSGGSGGGGGGGGGDGGGTGGSSVGINMTPES